VGRLLLAGRRIEAEILAEERHYMVLEAIGYGAGVRAFVDLKSVRNSV